jgi:phage shock protein A
MKEELTKATQNLGSIKGRIKTEERAIKEKKDQMKADTDKAKALKEAGKEKLALQLCDRISTIQAEMESHKAVLAQQKKLAEQHEANRDRLMKSINECESQLKIMQTMDDVTKSNEALSVVNVDGAESAVTKFKNRSAKMQEKLDVSNALLEEQQNSSPTKLDDEVDAALGNSAGKSLFDSL